MQATYAGSRNSAFGVGTLFTNSGGNDNTAIGYNSKYLGSGGSNNTAVGSYSLYNSTGSYNSAFGKDSLKATTSGNENSAFGLGTLLNNTTGYGNTAVGNTSMNTNVDGFNNTAIGNGALYSNISGDKNIAIGLSAGYSLTGDNNIDIGNGGVAAESSTIRLGTSGTHLKTFIAGIYGITPAVASPNTVVIDSNGQLGSVAIGTAASNIVQLNATGKLPAVDGSLLTGVTVLSTIGGGTSTKVGTGALAMATASSSYDTAFGYNSLTAATGTNNTALGSWSGGAITTGSHNISIGHSANTFLNSGSYNVTVGDNAGPASTGGGIAINRITIGNDAVNSTDHSIMIGGPLTTSAFIKGISGVNAGGGAAMYVNSLGQLGVVASSRRFKENIETMADSSSRIFGLRPVTFNYKAEYGGGGLQYGLIAEEVDQVIPEMTIRDKDGQIETVAYQMLAPMLLNEVQKQQRQIDVQKGENEALKIENEGLKARLVKIEKALGL